MELLTLKEIVALLRCSAATIHRRLCERRAGKSSFPLPVSEGGKKRFWNRQDVENYLEEPKGRPRKKKAKRRINKRFRTDHFEKKVS